MKTVETIISEFYALRDKTVNFAIINEAYREQALSLYSEFVDNLEAIEERYHSTHFTNKLSGYLSDWD